VALTLCEPSEDDLRTQATLVNAKLEKFTLLCILVSEETMKSKVIKDLTHHSPASIMVADWGDGGSGGWENWKPGKPEKPKRPKKP
jgi:hypothetical protein